MSAEYSMPGAGAGGKLSAVYAGRVTASTGHTATQCPHRMQPVSRMGIALPRLSAPRNVTGHSLMHSPQAVHLSGSMMVVCACMDVIMQGHQPVGKPRDNLSNPQGGEIVV